MSRPITLREPGVLIAFLRSARPPPGLFLRFIENLHVLHDVSVNASFQCDRKVLQLFAPFLVFLGDFGTFGLETRTNGSHESVNKLDDLCKKHVWIDSKSLFSFSDWKSQLPLSQTQNISMSQTPIVPNSHVTQTSQFFYSFSGRWVVKSWNFRQRSERKLLFEVITISNNVPSMDSWNTFGIDSIEWRFNFFGDKELEVHTEPQKVLGNRKHAGPRQWLRWYRQIDSISARKAFIVSWKFVRVLRVVSKEAQNLQNPWILLNFWRHPIWKPKSKKILHTFRPFFYHSLWFSP